MSTEETAASPLNLDQEETSSAPDPDPAATEADALPAQPGFFILRHYLVDLSVESPFGRLSDEDIPALGLGHELQMAAAPLDPADNTYRVNVIVRLTAVAGEQAVFLAELTYRVDVRLHLIAEDAAERTLVVDVPDAIQPVLRAVLEQNGAWAGYPDMRIGNLDFATAYAQGQKSTF